jgi:hypothetical protein
MFSRKNFCMVSTSKEQFLGGKLNNAGEKWHHFRKAGAQAGSDEWPEVAYGGVRKPVMVVK